MDGCIETAYFGLIGVLRSSWMLTAWLQVLRQWCLSEMKMVRRRYR